MSEWGELHRKAMNLSDLATLALKRGEVERARTLYANAADIELRALLALDPAKVRTIRIMRESVEALRSKSRAF